MTDEGHVDGAAFRAAIGHFMSGVVVLTAADPEAEGSQQLHGMTVSAIASLSLEPPMLLACLNASSRTCAAVSRSGAFCVNVLAEEQQHLAAHFGRPSTDGRHRFEGVGWHPGLGGVPVLDDALAVIECQVADEVAGGRTHRVFLAEAVGASGREGAPLAYFRGGFGRVELAQDSATHLELRRMIIDRQVAPGQQLDAAELAAGQGVPERAVHYALTRLLAEGLVRREEDRGYVVNALDVSVSDDAHDARLTIELGVADLTVGKLSRQWLAELRRLADVTVHQGDTSGGAVVDSGQYIRANVAFHAHLVSGAAISTLSEAYERLSLPDLMSRALGTQVAIDPQLTQDHLELASAYERSDIAAVRDLLIRHTERAKMSQRQGIEQAGGRI
jgi:4-nitrophenol 2-monooxygenase / 4-nitrocatechol 4-monooxygenase, reductase component